MSIFKNILFLEDYPITLRTSDEAARSYAKGYGNHVASAQAFAPLGHAHAIERADVVACATPLAEESRPLEACN